MTNYSKLKSNVNKHLNYSRVLFILTLTIVIFVVVHYFEIYLPGLEKQIQDLGSFAFFGFILLFVIATPFFISVDTLCFAAGLLFPLLQGIIYVIFATYISAAVIFILGRYFFREKVETLLQRYQQFSKLDTVLAQNSLKIMLLLRMLPLPFALLSYAFSITQVQFKPYLIATSGILIYNTALVYLGYSTKHMVTAVSSGASASVSHYVMLVIVGIISIIILFFAIRNARHAIVQIAPELLESNELKHK